MDHNLLGRNLLHDYDNVLLDMALVEGATLEGPAREGVSSNWLDRQIDEDSGYTVKTALAALSKLKECRDELDKFTTDYWAFQVYGAGGWNRWYLWANGEVVFSAYHCTEASKREAERLGFRMS